MIKFIGTLMIYIQIKTGIDLGMNIEKMIVYDLQTLYILISGATKWVLHSGLINSLNDVVPIFIPVTELLNKASSIPIDGPVLIRLLEQAQLQQLHMQIGVFQQQIDVFQQQIITPSVELQIQQIQQQIDNLIIQQQIDYSSIQQQIQQVQIQQLLVEKMQLQQVNVQQLQHQQFQVQLETVQTQVGTVKAQVEVVQTRVGNMEHVQVHQYRVIDDIYKELRT